MANGEVKLNKRVSNPAGTFLNASDVGTAFLQKPEQRKFRRLVEAQATERARI